MRFQDSWVVERTMLEYVNQGNCSCCGTSHTMMQFSEFAMKCSDWESDDKNNEINSPWPGFIHEEVLIDRIKTRSRMKEKLPFYQQFVQEELEDFATWWKSNDSKNRVFQYSVEELMDYFKFTCDIKSAYSVLLCAVSEQLKNFTKTGYTNDGRTFAELEFEKHLEFKNGAFTVDSEYYGAGPCEDDNDGSKKDDSFVEMLKQLGGPRLLPSRKSTEVQECDDNNNESGDTTIEDLLDSRYSEPLQIALFESTKKVKHNNIYS